MATAGASPGGDRLSDQGASISEDQLFELLSNQRRRHILHALAREQGPIEVGELSREIAAWEDDTTVQEVTSTDRKRVYTAIQQSHLPKMDKAGVLEYDRNHAVVEPSEALADVEIYMDVVRGRQLPWSDHYLALSGVAALVLAVSAFGLAPVSLLPTATWGFVFVAAVAISALAHRLYSRRNRLGIDGRPPELESTGDDP